MNTGVQKSGLTPFGAKTTTTPLKGNARPKKDMLAITAAHGISYASSASVGYLEDYIRKIKKAAGIRGTKYIHVLAPCPTGWGIGADETIEIAREAVDVGAWKLQEFENGEWTLNRKASRPQDLAKYYKRQNRFATLNLEDLENAER
jgi:pyruvate ferredoxin oxidoreductase beta subunit